MIFLKLSEETDVDFLKATYTLEVTEEQFENILQFLCLKIVKTNKNVNLKHAIDLKKVF